MDDQYTEVLVPVKNHLPEIPIKVILIGITVFLMVLGIFNLLFLGAGVVMIIVVVITFQRFHKEWEYLYVNGSLDIDRILAQNSRKHITSYDLLQAEVVAPISSPELKKYEHGKIEDYSSGYDDHSVYEAVFTDGNLVRRLRFEPNEVLLKDLARRMPRKVFQ